MTWDQTQNGASRGTTPQRHLTVGSVGSVNDGLPAHGKGEVNVKCNLFSMRGYFFNHFDTKWPFYFLGPTAIFLPQAADAAIDALSADDEAESDQGIQSGFV